MAVTLRVLYMLTVQMVPWILSQPFQRVNAQFGAGLGVSVTGLLLG